MERKACFIRQGYKSQERRGNDIIFRYFTLLKEENANLMLELRNIFDKMQKIQNIVLQTSIFQIQ